MRSSLKPSSLRSFATAFSIGVVATVLPVTNAGLGQQPGPTSGNTPGVSATTPVQRPTLKSGSSGNEVTELQATLKLMGFYNGSIDGVYGQTTVNAVSSFQQAAGLDADGIAGPATWNRLFPPTSALAAAPMSSATADQPKPAQTVSSNPKPASNPSNSTTNGSKPSNTKPASGSEPVGSNRPSTQVAAVAKKSGSTDTATNSGQPTNLEAVALPVLKLGMKGPAVTGLQYRLKSIGVLKSGADGVFGPETQNAVKAAQRKFKLEPDGVVGPATWIELLQ